MPKFEAKKGDFAKIWQKLGGGGGGATAPRLRRLCLCRRKYKCFNFGVHVDIPQGVLAIFIYGGVHMKGQIQTPKYGFAVSFSPKNIVILYIFYPKIWVTILF